MSWIALRGMFRGLDLYRASLGRELGILRSEYVAVEHLVLDGPTTPGEIGEYLGLRSGSVTAMLDRLENAELVERHPHPADRRSVLVTPTEAGRQGVEWTWTRMSEALTAIVEQVPTPLSEQALRDLIDTAGRVMTERARALDAAHVPPTTPE